MTTQVFFAVILAALLHAVWNAAVKGDVNKNLAMCGVMIGHMPIALVALAYFPMPANASWPYLFYGMLLHLGYQLFLLASYRIGDLTQVYPIARGVAPLIVTAVSVLFLNVELNGYELAAVLILATGIISIGLARQSNGLRNHKAGLLALATGCFIASYSIVDGTGARLSGSPIAFYAVLGIANGIIFAVFMAWYDRPSLMLLPTKGLKIFIIGGNASFIAYALVMWAFTQAPIPLVTALRETSIIFALLIGVVFLKEKFNWLKVFSIIATLVGVVLLRLGKS